MTSCKQTTGDRHAETDVNQLLQELDAAFGELPIPTDDNIVYDNTGYHLECNEIRRRFRSRHWRDFDLAELVEHVDALSFFTPEAFRFYLPAFVRASIQDYLGSDQIPQRVLWALAPPSVPMPKARTPNQPCVQGRTSTWVQLASEILKAEDPEADAMIARRTRRRCELFTSSQKKVLLDFVAFLRLYRSADFRLDELDTVENALSGPKPS